MESPTLFNIPSTSKSIKESVAKFRQSVFVGSKKGRMNLLRKLESKKNEEWSTKFRLFWRSQDVFGEQVHLTFKGKRSYQTSIGALFSVFIKMILTLYIVFELYVIYTRKHP
jgi:hypothetical protein